MRTTIYISIILLFISCKQADSSNDGRINITDLKYSTYIWRYSQDTYNPYFYLYSYLHIDSIGKYKLMRRESFNSDLKYFKGTLGNSERSIIDSILKENKFFPKERTDDRLLDTDTPFVIYNGLTYLLDYKSADKIGRTRIEYISSPQRAPENILFLTSFLDNIISNKENKVDNFTIGSYLDTLKKLSLFTRPPIPSAPPPLKSKINQTK